MEPITAWTVDSFFSRFFSQIYAYLSVDTGASPPDVEDLAQETLLSAWRGRDKFRGESALLTWALAIARNKAREYRRRAARTSKAIAAARELERLETAPLSGSSLESDELRRVVRRALATLPEEFSTVLVRRYFHGQSLRTIAEELDEPEKTIESRLYRARDLLRSRLTEGVEHV